MKGSFQILKAFDIPVRIHWSFGLIFAGIGYYGISQGWDWQSMSWTSLLIISLFACVVLHEFGHALTAKYYGVRTRDIILLPIGGLARLDRLPEKPLQEFMVAVAGPAVNLVIMVLLLPYLYLGMNGSIEMLFGLFDPYSNVFLDEISPFDSFVIGLMGMNGILAVFNLIPAFPMDGGRVLRALLSLRLGRLKATRIASYIGQFFAVLLAVYGLSNSSFLTALIGIFVFVMAGNEYKMIRIEDILKKHRVSDIIRRQYTKFYQTDALHLAEEQLKRGLERSFLVFDQWQNLRGVLSENKIMEAIKKEKGADQIGGYVSRKYEALVPDDSLAKVLGKMQQKNYSVLPVYENGAVIGVVDEGMVQHFLQIQEKLNR
jgi:Zn-dependent protease